MEYEGEDCCWVADYHRASDLTETQTTKVPVPYVWLREYLPHTPDEYDAYESAAKEDAANGVNKVWECYVAGLNPTNAALVLVMYCVGISKKNRFPGLQVCHGWSMMRGGR